MPDAPALMEFGTNHLADGWLNAAELRKTTNIRIELSLEECGSREWSSRGLVKWRDAGALKADDLECR